MVDKIDRSEAPPAYFISRSKDAKESQHQQSQGRDEQEQRYQKEITERSWEKFDKRTRTVKAFRTRRDQILRCLFRSVILHNGIGTLQLDVIWKDGHQTSGALVLLKKLEDYLKLKRFGPGQEIPDTYWSHGEMVELGIIELIAASSPMPVNTITSQVNLQDSKRADVSVIKNKRSLIIGLIATFIVLLIIIVTLILR